MKHFRIVTALTSAAFAALACSQGFFDTFDTIDPSWGTDRYDPAGFAVENFQGDNRLRVDISTADSYNNRPPGYNSTFYNTQGKKRLNTLGTPWTVSADLYVSPEFLSTTTGDPLMRSDVWTRDSAPTEATANYTIFGLIRNDDADGFNPNAANITTRYRVWDSHIGWITLTDTPTLGWHNLKAVSTGTSFEYYLDGSLVHTDLTYSDPGSESLSAVFINTYNFSDATEPGTDYHVYWDNLQAVPEPATLAVLGLGALALMRRRRRA